MNLDRLSIRRLRGRKLDLRESDFRRIPRRGPQPNAHYLGQRPVKNQYKDREDPLAYNACLFCSSTTEIAGGGWYFSNRGHPTNIDAHPQPHLELKNAAAKTQNLYKL